VNHGWWAGRRGNESTKKRGKIGKGKRRPSSNPHKKLKTTGLDADPVKEK
jgi:hypothetical protein